MTMTESSGSESPIGGDPSTVDPEHSAAEYGTGGADLRKGDPDHRVLAGVCTGLGRYTSIDPIAWRSAFALTAFAGGVGVLLYIASWMLMRDAQGGPSTLEQMLNRSIAPQAVPKLLAVGLTLSTGLSLIGGFGWGTMVLATPLILGLLAARNRGVDLRASFLALREELRSAEPPPTPSSPEPSPAYYNPAQPWVSASHGPVDLAVVSERGSSDTSTENDENDENGKWWDAGEERSDEGRESGEDDRRKYSLASVAFWLIIAGFVAAPMVMFGEVSELWGARAADLLLGPETGVYFLAGALAIVGSCAVVGTRWGRTGGLWALGVLVTTAMVLSTVTDLTQVRVGSETWRPQTVAEAEEADLRLTLGSGTVDLSALQDLEPGQELDLQVRVNGHTELVLPEEARVRLDSWVALGGVNMPTEEQAGPSGYNVNHHEVFDPGGSELPVINVRTESYIGHVEVRHDQAQD